MSHWVFWQSKSEIERYTHPGQTPHSLGSKCFAKVSQQQIEDALFRARSHCCLVHGAAHQFRVAYVNP